MDTLIPLIQESLSNNQNISFKVKGTSMKPFFVDGETEVTLAPFEGELVKLKVYLYEVNNKYLLHRYVETKNDEHYFRGDALYQFEIVQKENIVGVVKEMKFRGEVISCNDRSYRNNVRYYLFKKTIKLFIRRIIKGK